VLVSQIAALEQTYAATTGAAHHQVTPEYTIPVCNYKDANGISVCNVVLHGKGKLCSTHFNQVHPKVNDGARQAPRQVHVNVTRNGSNEPTRCRYLDNNVPSCDVMIPRAANGSLVWFCEEHRSIIDEKKAASRAATNTAAEPTLPNPDEQDI
jgi:hypothetical protein